MNSIHFVLQGKSGIGKSLIAVLIAQYLKRMGQKVVCTDTDPVNATAVGSPLRSLSGKTKTNEFKPIPHTKSNPKHNPKERT